jgi:hypothetical protein
VIVFLLVFQLKTIQLISLDIEAISNDMNCSTYQQVTANAQEAIEAIANDVC